MNDNGEMRLIVTKHGNEYVLPASAGLTWAQRYPGTQPPKNCGNQKFWQTPDGWVITRPEDEHDA